MLTVLRVKQNSLEGSISSIVLMIFKTVGSIELLIMSMITIFHISWLVVCTISDRTSRKLKYLHHPRELHGDLLNYALDFPSSCLVNNCTHTWAYLHTSWYTSTTMLLPILFITSKRQVGLIQEKVIKNQKRLNVVIL